MSVGGYTTHLLSITYMLTKDYSLKSVWESKVIHHSNFVQARATKKNKQLKIGYVLE